MTRVKHVRSALTSQLLDASSAASSPTIPTRRLFSQQANILGVLYDVIPKDRQQDVLRRMLAIEPGTTPNGVLSASYYFRYYLARALDHAGMADDYLEVPRSLAQTAPAALQHLAGDSRRYAFRLARLVRPSHLRHAHPGSRHRTGKSRLRYRPHRATPRSAQFT